MRIIPYEIVYLITFLFIVYVISRLFRILAGSPCSRKMEIASYLIYYCVITSAYLTFGLPILNFLINITGLLLLSEIYQRDWKKNLISVIFIYLLLLLGEIIAICVCGFVPGGLVESTESAPVMGLFVQCMIDFLLVEVIKQFKMLKNGEVIPWSCWMCIFGIPLLSILFIFLLIGNISNSLMVTNAVIILLIDFLVIYLYDYLIVSLQEKSKSRLIEEQNKGYAKEIASMKEAQESMRLLRHDLKNHMLAIQIKLQNQR